VLEADPALDVDVRVFGFWSAGLFLDDFFWFCAKEIISSLSALFACLLLW